MLAVVDVSEPAGLERKQEYVQVYLQVSIGDSAIIAVNQKSGKSVYSQIDKQSIPEKGGEMLSILFPVTLKANEQQRWLLQTAAGQKSPQTDLSLTGSGFDLQINNKYYRADLSKSGDSEAKSHNSGQLRELLIKMGFNRLLFRTENRLHWGPNFQKPELEYYTTISGWEDPGYYRVKRGPYRVRTERQDLAPSHPEILLTAAYDFYAGKPWFIFYSEMEMQKDVELELLRNDEMTMDSMFTHVAFERPGGEIVNVKFSERYGLLQENPIENDAPWLCFYHADSGYGFASIRLEYDNNNRFGKPSPTWLPHTKISDGAGGGKYWNRRLIHEHLTFVPEGSRYLEKNAYLVFSMEKAGDFSMVRYFAGRLRNPLRVSVKPQ
ncbi:MAG: hypothetical protein WAN36_15710 [Calditrichia bacterium]